MKARENDVSALNEEDFGSYKLTLRETKNGKSFAMGDIIVENGNFSLKITTFPVYPTKKYTASFELSVTEKSSGKILIKSPINLIIGEKISSDDAFDDDINSAKVVGTGALK